MKLPNGERAEVDVGRKLIGYCLNKSHATGKHKARVFESVLGITAKNANILSDALQLAAQENDAKLHSQSADAAKYMIDSLIKGPRGVAVVRSGWVVERGTAVPRLTTCYVKISRKGSRQ